MKIISKKIYAFFLPQFHECVYNNEWWGRGFTEWENVKKTEKLYDEHDQPRIPKDGYYDLTTPGELSKQYKNAKEFGIDGFVMYHYWYEGETPLSKPLNLILEDKTIDFCFSLCWANHSWTRSWTNRVGALDVLIEQTYEASSDSRALHFKYLAKAFIDSRYIQKEGKPLFQIYAPENIPNLDVFAKELRSYMQINYNLDLHISAMITARQNSWAYLSIFDSVTFFQPSLALFSPIDLFKVTKDKISFKLIQSKIRSLPQPIKKILYLLQDKFFNFPHFYSYDKVWTDLINQYKFSKESKYRVLPSAFVNFDNSPRYKNRARITKGYSLEKFRKFIFILYRENIEEELFINAWNEWGEGMFLEEDVLENDDRLNVILKLKTCII